jgi:hypothetical protein
MKKLLFLIFFIYVLKIKNEKIQINRNIKNEGFHRTLETIYSINFKIKKNCKLIIKETISSKMYIDQDEIKNMIKFHESKNLTSKQFTYKLIGGDISVETPSWKSKNYTLIITRNLNQPNGIVEIPIHFRYNKAVLKKQYTIVRIKKPKIIVKCGKKVVIDDFIGNILKIKIPNGRLEDKNNVNFYTIFISLFSTFIIFLFIFKF